MSKQDRSQNAKQQKKNMIIGVSLSATIALLVGVGIAVLIPKENQYKQAQAYMEQHQYLEAMDLLHDLKGYKKANALYTKASCMYNGDYKTIVEQYNITDFVIPEGVTYIKPFLFRDCTKLKSITIPDSVTSIGESVFYGCTNLTNVTLGKGVTSIGGRAFYNCESLTNITLPDTLMSIGGHAFFNCDSLTSITIPNSVTDIGYGAFNDCNSLTNVNIGNNVTSIGSYAFKLCGNLTNVTIPATVTYIGYGAFNNCNNLTTATFENPYGWSTFYTIVTGNGVPVSSDDLVNTSTAAQYLAGYYDHTWRRR